MSVIRAIAVFLCGFLSLRLCRAQILFPGPCPDIAAMTDFNANRVSYYQFEKANDSNSAIRDYICAFTI